MYVSFCLLHSFLWMLWLIHPDYIIIPVSFLVNPAFFRLLSIFYRQLAHILAFRFLLFYNKRTKAIRRTAHMLSKLKAFLTANNIQRRLLLIISLFIISSIIMVSFLSHLRFVSQFYNGYSLFAPFVQLGDISNIVFLTTLSGIAIVYLSTNVLWLW